MAVNKLPALQTPPYLGDNPSLYRWLTDVKTVLENINLTPSADVTVTDEQIQALVEAGLKGTPGTPGAPGAPGQTSYFHVAYADSADGSVNFNQVGGIYIGTYVDFTATDSADFNDYSWSKFEGTDGIPGTNGINGETSYLHLKYSNDGISFTPDTGNGLGEDVGDWLGQYVDFVATDSLVFSDYTWKKISGENGIDGIDGTDGINGADGTDSYFHVAYADSSDGSVNFNQIGGEYIGTYVDSNPVDSNNYLDYNWVLLKGADGVDGQDGIPGVDGQDGQTSYLHIKYSPDGLVFSGNNGEDVDAWIGTYVDFTLADSNTFGDYTWKKIEGAQGPQGDTGLASYFYTAYGDDQVGTNFSMTYTNHAYMGTYTSHSDTQSTDPADYTWVLIKGSDGAGVPATSVTPVALTGLTAIPSRTFTILTWDAIPTGNDAQHTIIYRNGVDDPLTAYIVGTSKTLIYADYTPNDGTYYYWIASQSRGSVATPEGITGPKNTDSPTINAAINSKITAANANEYLAFDAIGADFIATANLAALSAILGDVTAGTLSNADGTFMIDLINKFIQISGPAGSTSDDFIKIQNGEIVHNVWTGTTHEVGKKLSKIEAGVAFNGATVSLPGYWRTQPKIIVTAHDTPIYKSANSGQDQKIQIRAENVTENPPGSGSWQFDAVSRLVLSDSSVSELINESVGPSSNNTLTSVVYTTPANTATTTVSVDFSSIRSTATAGIYNFRTVTWTIYYRAAGSADAWVPVSAGATAIGQTLNTVNDTQLVTYPSAGLWEFYIEAVCSDAGGTWDAGTGGYEYDTQTLSTSTPSTFDFQHTINSQYVEHIDPAEASLPSFTPAPGFQVSDVYEVNHTLNIDWYFDATQTGGGELALYKSQALSAPFTPIAGNLWDYLNFGTHNNVDMNQYSPFDVTYNTSSFQPTKMESRMATYLNPSYIGHTRLRINSASAVVKSRKIITASETPSNTLIVNDFSHDLTGASVLQEGTLGWQAIL